ncbi:hypothetical protein [Gryllotalpicola protaetiae]|nr:hypothetical protein [Gryllotalpicola protaetiae]
MPRRKIGSASGPSSRAGLGSPAALIAPSSSSRAPFGAGATRYR